MFSARSGLSVVLTALAVSVAASVAPLAPAVAARPVRGARYVDGDHVLTVRLVVSRSGRYLNPHRSLVYDSGCSTRTAIGTPRRPVRIRRDGTFGYARHVGRTVMRIRGRFRTKDLARIVFRHERVPPRNGRSCDRAAVVYHPGRLHRIPFHDCASHKAKTVLSGPTGRIFEQIEWDDGLSLWKTVAYGCLFSANKRFRLGVDDLESGDGDLSLFRLAGPYVAFAESGFTGAESPIGLNVVDLRTGTSRPLDGIYPRDVALKDTGAVAWIGQAQFPDGMRGAFGVYADDSTGRDRLLDSGSRIDLDSLELNGSTLTWLKDGTTHSATLN